MSNVIDIKESNSKTTRHINNGSNTEITVHSKFFADMKLDNSNRRTEFKCLDKGASFFYDFEFCPDEIPTGIYIKTGKRSAMLIATAYDIGKEFSYTIEEPEGERFEKYKFAKDVLVVPCHKHIGFY